MSRRLPGSGFRSAIYRFATDTLTFTAKAGYRFANRDRIELAYANKSVDYSNREVGDADRSSLLGAVRHACARVGHDARRPMNSRR